MAQCRALFLTLAENAEFEHVLQLACSVAGLARRPAQLEAAVPAAELLRAILDNYPTDAALGPVLRLLNILAPASRDEDAGAAPARQPDDLYQHLSDRDAGRSPSGPIVYANRSDDLPVLAYKGMASRKKGREPLYRAYAKNSRFRSWRMREAQSRPAPSPWVQYRSGLVASVFDALKGRRDAYGALQMLCAALRLELAGLVRISGPVCAAVLFVQAADGALAETEALFQNFTDMGYASPELSAAHLHCLADRVIPESSPSPRQSSMEEAVSGKIRRAPRFVPPKAAIPGAQRVLDEFDRLFPDPEEEARARGGAEASTSATVPDTAYGALLKACAYARDAPSGQRVLARMRARAVSPGLYLWTKELELYEAVNDHAAALRLMDAILQQEGPRADLGVWTALIKFSGRLGYLEHSFALWDEMVKAGHTPTRPLFHALMKACVVAFHGERAEKVFQWMVDAGVEPSTETYNILIKGSRPIPGQEPRGRHVDRAMAWLAQLKTSGLPADHLTFTSIISLCGEAGMSFQAFSLFEDALRCGLRPDAPMITALMKAGNASQQAALKALEVLETVRREYPSAGNSRHALVACVKMLCTAGLPTQASYVYNLLREAGHPPSNALFQRLLVAAAEAAKPSAAMTASNASGFPTHHGYLVDLHGLSSLEARAAVLGALGRLQMRHRLKSEPPKFDLVLIPGQGIHSGDAGTRGKEGSKVRRAVMSLLGDLNLHIEEEPVEEELTDFARTYVFRASSATAAAQAVAAAPPESEDGSARESDVGSDVQQPSVGPSGTDPESKAQSPNSKTAVARRPRVLNQGVLVVLRHTLEEWLVKFSDIKTPPRKSWSM